MPAATSAIDWQLVPPRAVPFTFATTMAAETAASSDYSAFATFHHPSAIDTFAAIIVFNSSCPYYSSS